ncbi:MAG TPA: MCE family protein [Mycobacteriales bacterium]|nr:MCE family protein [Mycobacteriales bacterium]
MRPFHERSPLVIGAVGLAMLALVMVLAFNAGSLPLIGGGTTYTAAFSEAGGLKPDDEVRIAGVKVGKVTGVDLEGDHVRVSFQVKGAWVGAESHADIKIKTLLGAKYLSVSPLGERPLDAGQEIPISRTSAPFDVVPAFSELTRVAGQIDTVQLARAFDTLAATFQNTPAQLKRSLAGLSTLSRTIASRDAALRTLLQRTRDVSKTLADRDTELTTLLSDGNLLLREVQSRRDIIHSLLRSSAQLAVQLRGVVQDNARQLGPALAQLQQVVDTLQRNQDALDRGLGLLAPYLRVFTNTLGNGRWFDTYIQNLVTPVPASVSIRPAPPACTVPGGC